MTNKCLGTQSTSAFDLHYAAVTSRLRPSGNANYKAQKAAGVFVWLSPPELPPCVHDSQTNLSMCDCGVEFGYSLESMAIRQRRPQFAARPALLYA
jgi:hypothetical protein